MDQTLNKLPKITVFMPVYNGEKYLREAIESILSQTFTDFEFLIINDGSTDKSVEIIKSYNDKRIRLIDNQQNLGLAKVCNLGMSLANGEYVARMDCDDISVKTRLAKQTKFMDMHGEVGICGTWIKMFGTINYKNIYPTTDEKLKARLLFNTCFAHPSVIIRKKIFIDNHLKFKKELEPGDDYYLWTEASIATSFACLPKILLYYRMHTDNISKIKSTQQKIGATHARLNMLKKLGIVPTDKELKIHSSLKSDSMQTKYFLEYSEEWLNKLIKINRIKKIYKEKILKETIANRWLHVCKNNSEQGFYVWKKFWRSPLSKNIKWADQKEVIKFFIRCLIRK